MFATGVTMGLAEWIIDDICLVILYFASHFCIYIHGTNDHYCNWSMGEDLEIALTHNNNLAAYGSGILFTLKDIMIKLVFALF